jgi:DUF438 domain-containing protein
VRNATKERQVCDNHRECESEGRRGFGGPRRHAHAGLEWHGEWRGQEIVRTLIDALGVEVTVIDADDRIVGFSGGNRLFARNEDMLGTSLYGVHPPASRDAVREVLDALRSGEGERSRETPLPDGGAALVQYVARRDGEGRYLGCMQLARRVER